MTEITNEMWDKAIDKLQTRLRELQGSNNADNSELWLCRAMLNLVATGTRNETIYNAIMSL